jgi:hypothetical protein
VSGHIPKLLGTWGLSTIILGKSVSQERKPKRGNSYGLGQQFLGESSLCMRDKERAKKHSLKLMQPWRENSRASWSVIGVNWSWKTEESSCQA